jgi:hypothetical protein
MEKRCASEARLMMHLAGLVATKTAGSSDGAVSRLKAKRANVFRAPAPFSTPHFLKF